MSAPPTAQQAHELAAAARARPLLVIVANGGSGPNAGGAAAEALRTLLAGSDRPHRFVPVQPGELVAACDEAAAIAAREGGVLVAAGGDGTVNCAAQAALRHGCPLGLVPLGTFNLFARDHGIPLEPAEAVNALLDAQPCEVQVGLVNQRVFLANAAVGLYPKLLEDRENAKERLGKRRRWIALAAGLVTLFEWRLPLALDVELDGQVTRVRTPSVFVCNNRVQLERVGIGPQVVEQVGRGAMAALFAAPLGAWAKLKLLGLAMVGRLGGAREVAALPMRSLNIDLRHARKLKVATDGEVQWMTLPLRFSLSPQRLTLMVPRAGGDGAA